MYLSVYELGGSSNMNKINFDLSQNIPVKRLKYNFTIQKARPRSAFGRFLIVFFFFFYFPLRNGGNHNLFGGLPLYKKPTEFHCRTISSSWTWAGTPRIRPGCDIPNRPWTAAVDVIHWTHRVLSTYPPGARERSLAIASMHFSCGGYTAFVRRVTKPNA